MSDSPISPRLAARMKDLQEDNKRLRDSLEQLSQMCLDLLDGNPELETRVRATALSALKEAQK